MKATYMMLFSKLGSDLTDQGFYEQELRLAELAEPLGYSGICSVEHHFDGPYSMCPDNLQVLSYLAGRTKTITLSPAALILPWHKDPLRTVEKLAMLDVLSAGRLKVGFGRGLAKKEYDIFGIDMNEARERFDEVAEIVINGMETGIVEADGKFYKQKRAQIVPAPLRGIRDRLFSVAMSEGSVKQAADMGAQMATFIQFPAEQHLPLIQIYRDRYRAVHAREPGPIIFTELLYCYEDPEEAQRVAMEYIQRYYLTFMNHYDFIDGSHFAGLSGYQSYDALVGAIRANGLDKSAEAFAKAQTWGTPAQILERVRYNRAAIGEYELNICFSFGGLPAEKAEASMRLFSKEVLPELEKLGVAVAPRATEQRAVAE